MEVLLFLFFSSPPLLPTLLQSLLPLLRRQPPPTILHPPCGHGIIRLAEPIPHILPAGAVTKSLWNAPDTRTEVQNVGCCKSCLRGSTRRCDKGKRRAAPTATGRGRGVCLTNL